ncbi:MAG: asparagine synthetase A [Actinomycetota bacterium]|nr:asparagine synthetase A [Actinomycetota bacterium]
MTDAIVVDGWHVSHRRFLDIIDDGRTRLLVGLQDLVTTATADFWAGRGVKNLHLPITTGAVSSPMGLGSDSQPVQVSLCGVDTYLADSMQFMLEYGCRISPRGAWYLMPSFRGETTDRTHLAQFFHSEAEVPGDLEEMMRVVELYLHHLTAAVLDRHGDEVRAEAGTTDHLETMLERDIFSRLTFAEAARHLAGDERAVRTEPGGWRVLTRHGEQRLLAEISPFVWVTHYDHLAVPFYQGFADGNRRVARNADLLFGIGEVVGSGERHANAEEVLEALAIHQVDPAQYRWYTDMKAERPMQTAGFGLGVERWLMWVLQAQDIREMQLVPRANGVALVP